LFLELEDKGKRLKVKGFKNYSRKLRFVFIKPAIIDEISLASESHLLPISAAM
jgi:hypothetical protein